MEKNNNARQVAAELLGGSPARYRVTRVTRIDKNGSKETKKVNIEVDDIESFRKKMRGSKFADVQFVYESII